MVHRSMKTSLVPLFCIVALGCATAACGGKNKDKGTKLMKQEKDDKKVAAKVDPSLCEIKGKKIVTSDLDRDNKPDVWRLYATVEEGETTVEFLSCRQTDYDHDGEKDHVIAFTQKGAKTFEKFDFDFDGRFDAFYQYDPKTGQKFEVQRETGFDGRYDVQEVYDDKETLKTVKHDRNSDGNPDMWEQWVGEELVAILYDDDYDSKVDRREEKKLAPKKPSAENATASSDSSDPEADPDGGDKPEGDKPEGDKPEGDGADGGDKASDSDADSGDKSE